MDAAPFESEKIGPGARRLLKRSDFNHLITAVRGAGYRVIGPTVENSAVVYREIETDGALPDGVASRQGAGRYVLEERGDRALFGYVAGAQSWRPHLFQPSRQLWRDEKQGDEIVFTTPPEETPRLAFLGMRACELAGIALQDRALMEGDAPDPDYSARRKKALFIAVNCGTAGETCFCVSTNTGPRIEKDFDLALTELLSDDRHDFLVEIGSEAGAAIAAALPLQPAAPEDLTEADEIVTRTAASMGRRLEMDGLKEMLQANQENEHWARIGEKCLACANCTLVCPTCFCHTTEDVTDLDGVSAARRQRWDSCFSLEFSHLHGGSVRPSVEARYRQWMTHKLAHWIAQFGSAGCVGCGRCVTWCPAGIDITEEAAGLRRSVEGSEENGDQDA